MVKGKKIIIIGIILILVGMAVIPSIQGVTLKQKNENNILEKTNLGSRYLYVKICYLECLDVVDGTTITPWDVNKKAEFNWKIRVVGGLDNEGNEQWKYRVKGGHQYLFENELESMVTPHEWDVTGLNEIPIMIELWDIDPKNHDILDINGKLGDDYPVHDGEKVFFYYYPEQDSINYLDSGGKEISLHGGCIEFNGDPEKKEDSELDAIIRIKIWTKSTAEGLSVEITHPEEGYFYFGDIKLFPMVIPGLHAVMLGSNKIRGTCYDAYGALKEIEVLKESEYFKTVMPDEQGSWSTTLANGGYVYTFTPIDTDGARGESLVARIGSF